MRGKVNGTPDQEASSASARSTPWAAVEFVSPLTAFEYQSMRVLISVLLMPAASTWISTSSARGRGTGTSVRYSSFSGPPWPVSNTAAIVVGRVSVDPFAGVQGALLRNAGQVRSSLNERC